MRYFSAFSGVGGFEIGIQRASEKYNESSHKCEKPEQEERKRWGERTTNQPEPQFRNRHETPLCVGFSEIDKHAIHTYQSHYPEHTNYGDITKINERELPDFDLFVGGFPCQAFSIAGKRRGFADTRGTLFFDIARIIQVKRPKLVLLENVKGLLNHEQGKTFGVIIQTLDELGYDVQWMVLNGKFFGVPQNRERVFFICSLRGLSRPEILPFRETNTNTDGLIIQEGEPRVANCLDANYGKGVSASSIRHTPRTMVSNVYGGFGEDIRQNEISPTIRTPSGGGHLPMLKDDTRIRRLTPTECERLMSWPDNWTLGSDTQRYKQCGNGIISNVVQAVMEKLLEWEAKQ